MLLKIPTRLSFIQSNRLFLYKSITRRFLSEYSVLKLRPSLLIDGEECPLKTGNTQVDQLVEQRLNADVTNVRGIFEFSSYIVHDIQFKEQKFILTISKEDGRSLDAEDGRFIDLDIVDPDDAGPDTWMESDISILNDTDDLPDRLIGKSIELIVRVDTLETNNGALIYKPI